MSTYHNDNRLLNEKLKHSVLTKWERLVRTKGRVRAVELFKLNRLAVTRYISKSPVKPGEAGCSITRDGLPKILPFEIRQLLRQRDPQTIRLTLTLLNITRTEMGGKKIDFSSITDKSEVDFKIFSDIVSYIPEFIILNKLQAYDYENDEKPYHWSTKAGPNGPALNTSLHDYFIMPQYFKYTILEMAPYLRETFSMYNELEDQFKEINKFFTKTNKTLLRKLSIRKDRETKSRIFAILDYWSQQALMGLHSHLFKQLKLLGKVDATFNQDSGIPHLVNTKQDVYYSIDLKEATDRFPLSLQRELIKALTDHDYARNWEELLVGDPYWYDGKSYKYETGQPMGAYSSWAAFTLTHHLLVRYCASVEGFRTFNSYAILGDDIVISNKQVAERYLTTLKALNVPISLAKTHVSDDTFEFAKRWYCNGFEVTPYPLSGLIEVSSRYYLLYPFLMDQVKKGYNLPSVRGAQSVLTLLQTMYGKGLLRLVEGVLTKYCLVAYLPHSAEEEDVKGLDFIKASAAPISCNWNKDNTLKYLRYWSIITFSSELRQNAERVMDSLSEYSRALRPFLKMENSPFQDKVTNLGLDLRRFIPQIEAFNNKVERGLESIPQGGIVQDLSTWKVIQETEILPTPTMLGIIPTRRSRRIELSNAIFANKIAKKLQSLRSIDSFVR